MMKYHWLTAILSVAFFCASILNAAILPFHEVKRDTISGISQVNYIDPILDGGSAQRGFVFSDSSDDRLLVQLNERDTLIKVGLPCAPLMTINRISGDSIIIYALMKWTNSGWDGLTIGSIVILGDDLFGTFRIIAVDRGLHPDITSLTLLDRSITFPRRNYANSDDGVIVEATLEGHYNIPGDLGVGSRLISRSVFYDLSLDTVKIDRPYSKLVAGSFLIADSTDYLGVMNLTWYKETNDTLQYAPATVLRGIRLDSSDFLTRPASGYTGGMTVDRISSDWADDIITLGTHSGFLQNHPFQEHLAAYSIRPDTLTELWYLPLPTIYPQYWKLGGYWSASFSHLLWRGDTCLYRFTPDGYILDSTFINSDFDCKKLYEFGADLYLALRTADTLQLLRWDVETSIDDSSSIQLPSSFTLSQNYPNPFNATTEIRFSLARTEDVALTIYNLLGQALRTLVDGKMTPGEHRVTWDGRDKSGAGCATGVYLYRLQTKDFSQSCKMILLN